MSVDAMYLFRWPMRCRTTQKFDMADCIRVATYETVSIRDAMWPPAYRNRGFVPPASLSIEKPYRRWLCQDGTFGLHIPDYNTTLTKFCINVLKDLAPAWKLLERRYVLHPDFSMTDEHWDWRVILIDIEQMERDVRPGGFNPGGLKLPCCGKNRIPWLWRTDMCPNQSDYAEETIFSIFSARLRTMDKVCDKNHTTEESPATLFLEAVAQWFETGGKCHLFGCVMTPFLGHATRFSFLRDLVQRRRAEDGGPFPTMKDQNSYRAAMRAQTSDADVQDDSDEEFDGDEGELDEEDALYAEHLREVDAMKTRSQAEPDVERLKELSDLQLQFADDDQNAEEDTKQQIMARIKAVVAELEEYMQKLAGDEENSTPKGPANSLTSTSDNRSSRAEIFQSHLTELQSINFFPQKLENTLDAINARMEEDQQFTPEEAFGIL
ncbi:uncharacterized protein MYCFIDRAFT_216508 [Pseudocercospora fijiensis CIRAD86]|uniref:Uncharacterized protein n=1 Tax=Pseudocercospora fijiensis (strain CIRAD86) TaxID=383855 RepID=M3AQA6_PSEFD|nr:uncharacterized protein MYCFIDRAFT_216508 [Pseudocercospora fijiensis CIRAD86]EME79622.1 hypothetical protein MYCFIDRAFT_216508 [Pseudocercospora fijiensis CIRAD86]